MKHDEITVSDDAVGIVCPTYCGNMPKMVHAFLKKAKITTGYFFIVYTYGKYDTVQRPNAATAARKAGLKLDYVNTLLMVDNYLPMFGASCERCYACVHNCPKKAIHLPEEKSGERFRNPEVSLKEIITANNQN